ncbi:MAG: 3-phosphoshikimate 1-carboxyvinyltransferase [Gammaproteobacteria bacterium]|nr:3-phosphoshikimate 1-carboxyvinyltransferase [Gammaproteobacteria bacterium]
MHFTVKPSAVTDATISVPGDKSISHRALMLGSIAEGRTEISGFLAGEDCLATLAAMRAMGIRIEQPTPTDVLVHGRGLHGLTEADRPLDLGNSGTAMRLMAGLLAGQPFVTTLTGDASLTSRPMQRVVAPLTAMGARIDSRDGRPPLVIHGTSALQAIDYKLPVASAQVKSAILLAALYADGTTTVVEPAVTRDHSERMLESMGADVVRAGNRISINAGQTLHGCHVQVPGDLSSAAFIILATLLSERAEVLIECVGVNPTRTGVIDILQTMGADISLEKPRLLGQEPAADIRVRASKLHGGPVDPALVSLAIDEFPILFVAAAAASGKTVFSSIGELRVKESDRIAAMASGLRALGIEVDETDDGAVVHGGRLMGGTVDSCGDHRIAMSLAIGATIAADAVTVHDVAAVDTSFPGFVGVMASLGIDIHAGSAERGGATSSPIPVITIDGPSGSGKGTIARNLANELGWHLLDSGALYRLVALAAGRAGIALDNAAGLARLAAALDIRFASDAEGAEQVFLDGEDVTQELRTEVCGAGASAVAGLQPVRDALLGLQREFRRAPGLVADGRDMGTHVFKDAGLKVFLTATPEERAKRRYKQLNDKGIDVSLAALSRDIEERDRRDSERSVAPLRPAEDARILDSSGKSIKDVTRTVLNWVSEV